MQQRLPSLLDPPITFAHRGARAHAPENTLEAFALALKLGASGLESDVWLTADGVAVLDHDGVVKTGLRKRPIREFRRDELPSHIPTLAELLHTCGTDYALSLDLKDPDSRPIASSRRSPTLDADMLERTWLCEPSLERVLALRRDVRRGRPHSGRLLQTTRLERIKGAARTTGRVPRRVMTSTGSTCTAPTGTVASWRSSTASGWSRSAGTSSTSTICARRCGWVSTPSTATTST